MQDCHLLVFGYEPALESGIGFDLSFESQFLKLNNDESGLDYVKYVKITILTQGKTGDNIDPCISFDAYDVFRFDDDSPTQHTIELYHTLTEDNESLATTYIDNNLYESYSAEPEGIWVMFEGFGAYLQEIWIA